MVEGQRVKICDEELTKWKTAQNLMSAAFGLGEEGNPCFRTVKSQPIARHNSFYHEGLNVCPLTRGEFFCGCSDENTFRLRVVPEVRILFLLKCKIRHPRWHRISRCRTLHCRFQNSMIRPKGVKA